MNWKTFKDTLLQHTGLHLQFRYAGDKMVDAAYHITEIKQAPVTSVDCGGVMNTWTEIIVQLWVPENGAQDAAMKVSKALSIVDVVERMLPLDADGTVKIEFGHAAFDTRQMHPNEILVDGDNLLVDLQPDAVQCKAISRGGSCGTEEPKAEPGDVAVAVGACCVPGGGCC
jgi:hypothetical protein